jgi:hypothetical protein
MVGLCLDANLTKDDTRCYFSGIIENIKANLVFSPLLSCTIFEVWDYYYQYLLLNTSIPESRGSVFMCDLKL